jgi:hypothetical protein
VFKNILIQKITEIFKKRIIRIELYKIVKK